MTINWTEIIKYLIAVALTGAITGGGSFVKQTAIKSRHQEQIGKLVQVLMVEKDCDK